MYRAVDSLGKTIDFLLTAHRDASAAKRFLRKALKAVRDQEPRVINVDKNAAYPKAKYKDLINCQTVDTWNTMSNTQLWCLTV